MVGNLTGCGTEFTAGLVMQYNVLIKQPLYTSWIHQALDLNFKIWTAQISWNKTLAPYELCTFIIINSFGPNWRIFGSHVLRLLLCVTGNRTVKLKKITETRGFISVESCAHLRSCIYMEEANYDIAVRRHGSLGSCMFALQMQKKML